jgi:hypothetical protein
MEKEYDGQKDIECSTYISGDGSMRIKYDPNEEIDKQFQIYSDDTCNLSIDLDEEGVQQVIDRLKMFLGVIIKD